MSTKAVKKPKIKNYQAKVATSMYPDGRWVTFETDEGVAGVRKHIKQKKWKLLSKIHPVA